MAKRIAPIEKNRRKLNLPRLLVFGFLFIILAGALLLTLPVAAEDGASTPLINTLFTATSATCITGLVVYDTATQWSFFGEAVILCMIQIGGLGFMTLGSALILLLRGDSSLSNRKQIAESLNMTDYKTAARTMKHVLLGTALFEGTGALILSARFIPEYGWWEGIWKGCFVSVSAFCNAGFDLLGTDAPFSSLTGYAGDVTVNLTVMGLIVIGGLGFLVWEDLYTKRRWKNLSLFSKTVLILTASLILGGAFFIFLFEFDNAATLEGLTWSEKILTSFFQSISPRTAGMNTIDLTAMTEASQVLTILLMFIGASSGSTGGGVKVTTVAVLAAAIRSVLTGRKDTILLKRRLSSDLVYRAFALVFLPIVAILICTFLINGIEPEISFLEALYECTSAFATVGLSLSVTPTLTALSKVLLMLLMFSGRVGMLTISYALLTDRRKRQNTLRYPEGDILIG
ncbi:MAG: Trk family potassium uptake protein [Clostridia bacterium]|nr:Trk family potassium uptake protein [Clostridia bacterium]